MGRPESEPLAERPASTRAPTNAAGGRSGLSAAAPDILASISEHAIIATGVDRIVTHFNQGAEKLLGYTADEVIGRSVPTDFHDLEEIATSGARLGVPVGPRLFASNAGEAHTSEWTFVHRDGRRFPVELTVNEMQNDTGGFVGYVGVARDISRRKLEEAAAAAHACEQAALLSVATLVAGGASPNAVFSAAAAHAAQVLGGISSGVFRLEPSGQARLVGCWTREDMPDLPIGEHLDLAGPTATAIALRTGAAQTATYLTGNTGLRGGPMLPLSSGAAALIEVEGRLWGAVGVGWDDASATDPAMLPRLSRFAALVSLAVTSAEAHEKLALIASTDHLTGLSNQRVFSDHLAGEVQRARLLDEQLSLVLIDLDHFKLVNDTHGHAVGNLALTELAERLTNLRREGDMLARIGGEEFAWILPKTDVAGAMKAAERARTLVAATPFSGVGRLSISAGCCALNDAPNSRELFRRADLALYWAKSNGRDTVYRYSDDTLALLSPDEQAQTLENAKTLAAVRALALAVDAKDPSTQRHSERVADLASEIARIAGWDEREIALLHDAALVHDVGKIGIPDRVLLKPGRLSAEEFEEIKPHAALGARMVNDLLTVEQVAWIRHHHERFDGAGYPDGIAGLDIPEGARILAVADTWDAMTVARPYATARSAPEALAECRRIAGAQLCPDAVSAFLELHLLERLTGRSVAGR